MVIKNVKICARIIFNCEEKTGMDKFNIRGEPMTESSMKKNIS